MSELRQRMIEDMRVRIQPTSPHFRRGDRMRGAVFVVGEFATCAPHLRGSHTAIGDLTPGRFDSMPIGATACRAV